MAPPPGMTRPLRLDERCVVLPVEDALHVLTRRGFHEVRGRGLDRLHRRLSPYLAGEHTEEELLAAVPRSRRSLLQRYLGSLRELGVLREEAAEGERPPHPVRFVSSQEAAELLLLPWHADGGPEPTTAVVVEGRTEPLGGAARRERAAYARWLRRNAEAVRPPEERFRLFRLDGTTGSLELLVSVGRRPKGDPGEGSDRGGASVPEQLGVVRPAAVDQVPLVVATASHPLFAPKVTGYGLSEPAVREELLRRFAARLILPSPEGAPSRAVAASPLELELRRREAAARRAARGGELSWEAVDLLAERPGHPTVAHLQEVLRLRRPRLPGRRGRTDDGSWVWEAAGLRAGSPLPDRALAELLLREVWKSYYSAGAAGEPVPVLDPADFASQEELRGLLSGAPGARRAGPRRLTLWGLTLYAEEEGHGDEDHLRRRALG